MAPPPAFSRCLFHIPMTIDPDGAVGSRVRPRRLLSAFREIGYEVDVIWGNASERRHALQEVKDKIRSGMGYDFLYSESSTMPTILTEKNHLPTDPFVDFELFRFCGRASIPVGLFYRDVHWRFEVYRRLVPWTKRLLSIPCYHLDLLAYRMWVDVLFLAHLDMLKYVRWWPSRKPVHELPPGGQAVSLGRAPSDGQLRLLYVGGVHVPGYDIANLLEGVYRATQHGIKVSLTICCPEAQWQNRPAAYDQWLGPWLAVVHLRGEELTALYQKHDVAMVYLVPRTYLQIAMPIKVFEAIGFGRPLIVGDDTAAADVVRQEGCGWSISADPAALEALLQELQTHPEEVEAKAAIARQIRHNHTWARRAERAADILIGIGQSRREHGPEPRV